MSLDRKNSRLVAGLMSGTSLDGVDVALARLTGTGRKMDVELIDFISFPYAEALRALLLKNSQPATSSVLEISQLNIRLAHLYADAIRQVVQKAGVSLEALEAIGCHGQTIYHVPDAADCAGMPVRSTLQIGDPSTLANLLSTTVVGDFRLADMAYGGQGAPLVPYFDYVYFSHPEERRALLNIGGIGNMSVLPAEKTSGDVYSGIVAFDTGPGNMVIDAIVQHFWQQPYDVSGQYAAEGNVDERLLGLLLDSAYYSRKPPKSTGREFYNEAYVEHVLSLAQQLGIQQPNDVIATVTRLTVETIVLAYQNFVEPHTPVQQIIASGGGVHNLSIMSGLRERLAPVPVVSMSEVGLDPDAKEALCFAVLAHETLNGIPSNVPGATGASRPAILGKICIP